MSEQVTKLKSVASSGAGTNNPGAALSSAKYVVQLGQLRNTSGVRSGDLDAVMRQAAKQKAGIIKGAVVLDGSDTALLQQASAQQIPVARVGQPEDIAATTSFLTSEESGFVSGQVIYVAGGPKD